MGPLGASRFMSFIYSFVLDVYFVTSSIARFVWDVYLYLIDGNWIARWYLYMIDGNGRWQWDPGIVRWYFDIVDGNGRW